MNFFTCTNLYIHCENIFQKRISNSAVPVMGTDEFGMPCRSSKICGKYHIIGHLQAATRTVFQDGFNEIRVGILQEIEVAG